MITRPEKAIKVSAPAHSWLHHVMRELPKAREMGVYDHLLPWNLDPTDLIRDLYPREAPTL